MRRTGWLASAALNLAVGRSQRVIPVAVPSTFSHGFRRGFADVKRLTTIEDYNEKLKTTVSFFTIKDKPKVLETVLNVCQMMKDAGVKPDLRTYNYLFEGLMTKNWLSKALELFQEMRDSNIHPDANTLNLLIKMHIPFGDFLGAMTIFEMFETLQLKPTSETFTSLINCCAMSSPHSFKVDVLVREMLSNDLYNPMAGAKAIDCLVYANHVEEAYNLLKILEKETSKLPASAYASALYGLCLHDNNEGVRHCFNLLRSGKMSGVILDEGLLLQVLYHARRTDDLDLAHQAVFAIEETKPEYLDLHFIPLLDLLAKKGSFFRLFELVLLMQAMKINLRLSGFREVVYQISRQPETMDKAYFALEDLKQHKPIDVFLFNVVLKGCAMGRDLDRTFATFAEAEKLGVIPNLETYHVLLEACYRTRQKKVAERVWSELQRTTLIPNTETYSRYIDVMLFSEDFDKARKAYEVVKELAIPLQEGVYVRLIVAATPIDKEFAIQVVHDMKKVGKFRVGNRLTRDLGIDASTLSSEAPEAGDGQDEPAQHQGN